MKASHRLLWFGKLILMGILLTIVIRQVQWADQSVIDAAGNATILPGVATSLKDMSPWYLVTAWLCLLFAVIFNAVRWHRLLTAIGLRFGLGEIIRLVYIGEFFNNFLLGSLGGDAVKIYLSLKKRSRKTSILTSIFADRLIGLISLCAIAAVMLAFQFIREDIGGQALILPLAPLACVGGGLLAGGIVLFSGRLRRFLKLERLINRLPLGEKLRRVREILQDLTTNLEHLPMIFLYSFGSQTLSIIGVAFLGASLDLGLDLPQYLMSVPLIFILSAVPLTPGGVGILEELFLIYLAAANNPNKILIMALLYRFIMILCGLPGLILFFTSEATERKLMQAGDRNL